MAGSLVDSNVKASFASLAVRKLSRSVDGSFGRGTRTFSRIRSVKKELNDQSLVLLESVNFSSLGVLLKTSFEERVSKALPALFKPFLGNIRKLKSDICALLGEAGFRNVTKAILLSTREIPGREGWLPLFRAA